MLYLIFFLAFACRYNYVKGGEIFSHVCAIYIQITYSFTTSVRRDQYFWSESRHGRHGTWLWVTAILSDLSRLANSLKLRVLWWGLNISILWVKVTRICYCAKKKTKMFNIEQQNYFSFTLEEKQKRPSHNWPWLTISHGHGVLKNIGNDHGRDCDLWQPWVMTVTPDTIHNTIIWKTVLSPLLPKRS